MEDKYEIRHENGLWCAYDKATGIYRIGFRSRETLEHVLRCMTERRPDCPEGMDWR